MVGAAVIRSTPAATVTFEGCAVRTHGGKVQVSIGPGEDGFVFVRDDTGQAYPADLDHLVPVPNCTALGDGGRPEVLFTEHVLSALAGLGIWSAEIHLQGPEVPLLDGSAQPFADALAAAGTVALAGEVAPLVITEPLWYVADGQCLGALPADGWAVNYTFAHEHPLLRLDQCVWDETTDYRLDIAPARTFATVEEIQALQAQGLVKGGSAENLLVIYADHTSAPLRLAHEYASHKVLDMLGDLALLGRPLQAQMVGYRTGHADNQAMARRILAAANS